MLARWPAQSDWYAYDRASSALVAAANAIGVLCHEANVPLAAAALNFSLRDPRITSTVIGMRTVADLEASVDLAAVDIPDELWDAINSVPLDSATWQG